MIRCARNDMVFNNNFVPISKSVELIKDDAFLWISTRSNLKAPNWENWKVFDIIDLM
ncbi:hypothetical protein Hanom_Chr04g00358031 [Helianthus anomalus]